MIVMILGLRATIQQIKANLKHSLNSSGAKGGNGGGLDASPQLSPRLIFQLVEIRTENGRGVG